MKKKELNKVAAPPIINDATTHSSQLLQLLKSKCLYMYETGKPFVLIKSGGTYTLTSNYFNSKAINRGVGFSTKDLHFIKKVKQSVIKSKISDKFMEEDYQSKKIDYINVKRFAVGEVMSDLLEIDITTAYWETAYMLGIIDKVIYKEGFRVNKKVRLAALGTLAKKTDTWVFDGKRMKTLPTVRNYTENLWFAICKRVSDVMGKAVKIAGSDFVFYWVDGIYIKNNKETLGKIVSYFSSCGYECKINAIADIVFTGNEFEVRGVKEEDLRVFTYPQTNKKNTIQKYNENLRLKKLAEELLR